MPTQVLFSEEPLDAFRHLHDTAALIERCAINAGYKKAKALAGGPFKELFCEDLPACPVIIENGPCRHPDRARPSMSGDGIDVSRLMTAAGWPQHQPASGKNPKTSQLRTIAALALLG